MKTFQIDGRDKRRPIRLTIEVDNQFEGGGRWLRGGLHSHVAQMGESREVCEHYIDLGFDFLATTDYLSITSMPEATEAFVTVPGAEVFCPGGDDLTHIICLGLTYLPRPLDGTVEDVSRLVRDTETQGGLAVLAHPAWSDYSWEKAYALAKSGLVGLEVSNRLTWQINGKERSEELWQMLFNAGVRLAAVGVDDAIVLDDADVTGRTWTGVLVRRPGVEGILEGLRAQRTYASEGPEIHDFRIEARGAVVVECSPCTACHIRSKGFGVRSLQSASPSNRFEVDLTVEGYRMRDWVFACVEDEFGRRAWTSAIPVRVDITCV